MLSLQLNCPRYLADNPDLATKHHDLYTHYWQYGRFEGRVAYSLKGQPLHLAAKQINWLARLLDLGYVSMALSELIYWYNQHDDASKWVAGKALCEWYFRQGDFKQCLALFQQLPLAAHKQPDYQHMAKRLAIHFAGKVKLTALNKSADINWLLKANQAASQQDSHAWLAALNQCYAAANLSTLAWHGQAPGIALHNLSRAGVASLPETNGPLVSIIIPMYNAEDNIEMVLSGLQQQSWQQIEIIVVDDASTDQSVAMVKHRALADHRIKLIQSSVNAGAYHARNLGLKQAKGDFITINDSDDWAHPDKIDLQLQALLQDPNKQASISYWIRMQANGHFLGCWKLAGPLIEKNHSSALFRRQVFAQLGFWDEVRIAADTEFLRRIEAHYGEHALVDVHPKLPLSLSLSRPDALTQQVASHVSTIDFGVRWAYRQLSQHWLQHTVYPFMPRGQRRFPLPISMQPQRQASLDLLLIADYRQGVDLTNVLGYLEQHKHLSCAILHWPNPLQNLPNTLHPEIHQRCGQGQLQLADQHSKLQVQQLVFTEVAASYWPDLRPTLLSLATTPVLLDGAPLTYFSLVHWHSQATPISQNLPKQAANLVADYFDATYYLQRYADIAQNKREPLSHFLQHGYQEGRLWAAPLPCFQQHPERFRVILRQYQTDLSDKAFRHFINAVVDDIQQQATAATDCLNFLSNSYPAQPAIKIVKAKNAYFAGDFTQSLAITAAIIERYRNATVPAYQHPVAKLWVQSLLACQGAASTYHAICYYRQAFADWPIGLILLLRHTLTDKNLLANAQQQLATIIAEPSKQSIEALLMMAQAAKQLGCYNLAQSLLVKRIQHVLILYPNGRPSKPSNTNQGFSERARQALLDLKHCLALSNTEFFLVSGTLLGCIREGKLLSHDKDIDVGIMAPINKAQLEQHIIEHPALALLPGPKDKLFVQHKNGVLIDIFIHWQENSLILHQGLTAAWWNSPFKLIPSTFLDETFLIPADYDRYLTENYGNWRIPNTEFDTFLDTTNMLIYNPNELQCYYLKAYAYYHLLQKLSLKKRIAEKLPVELQKSISV